MNQDSLKTNLKIWPGSPSNKFAVHVIVGEVASWESVKQKANQGKSLWWKVPKKSKPGEVAIFFFPDRGFVATGKIISLPKKAQFGRSPSLKPKLAA